jgi:putative flavoprotein involved in K+ transport
MTAGPAGSPLDVLVIGGGQAGLAMGYHLARSGRSFQIVDAGAEIGGRWRSRWDSLLLFTSGRYDNLPGLPFPAAQHTRGSALLGWVGSDAAFLAGQIARR